MIACLLDTRKLHPETSGTWLPKHDLGNDTTGRHANPGGGILKGLHSCQRNYRKFIFAGRRTTFSQDLPLIG